MDNTVHQAVAGELALELLERGLSARLIARGQSMWPFILDGDVIHLSPIVGAPTLGDVVLIPGGDFGRLHRIVSGPRDNTYCVRGDALPNIDGWFRPDELLGQVVNIHRRGRRIPMISGRFSVGVSSILSRARSLMRRFTNA